MNNKIKIEFQRFHGYTNEDKLLRTILNTIKGNEKYIDFQEVIIDTDELARKVGFLGSPTILIDGKDLMGLTPIINPSLSCRLYLNGLPSKEFISNVIKSRIKY